MKYCFVFFVTLICLIANCSARPEGDKGLSAAPTDGKQIERASDKTSEENDGNTNAQGDSNSRLQDFFKQIKQFLDSLNPFKKLLGSGASVPQLPDLPTTPSLPDMPLKPEAILQNPSVPSLPNIPKPSLGLP
uniref:Proline-rich protein sgp2 n=2 Tax=Glossina morsitans morsitans TaxID=37546 RepID=SGP2_GLOMM|nr:RecName: Full=Proline-rich protein sgp2; Flags: Precursor [Glossina morsitans morsitans]ABN80092.1 proline-rich protein [Glossina morsitans morsitans]